MHSSSWSIISELHREGGEREAGEREARGWSERERGK